MRDEENEREHREGSDAPALSAAPNRGFPTAEFGIVRWRSPEAEMRVPNGVWRASVQGRIDAALVIVRVIAGSLPAPALAALTRGAGEAWRQAERDKAPPAALDVLRAFVVAVTVMPRAMATGPR